MDLGFEQDIRKICDFVKVPTFELNFTPTTLLLLHLLLLLYFTLP